MVVERNDGTCTVLWAGIWRTFNSRPEEWQTRREAIDAVDSLKIAQRLNDAAAALGKRLPILVEVKLSHEESKHGLAPTELPALLAAIEELNSVEAVGLMTVPPWSLDPEPARPYFHELRHLRDESQKLHPKLTQLSMGMSNDFIVAIEEGSTCVRVGTALFGKRQPAELKAPS